MAISATAATLGAAAIGGVGSILAGWLGSNAATQASKTEAEAMDKAIGVQAAQYQQSRVDSFPWALAGAQALYKYMDELGVPRPVDPILPDLAAGPFGAASTYNGAGQGGAGTGTGTGANQNTWKPTPTADIPMTESLGFRQTPGYEFQVSEGEKSVNNNLAALGMRNSGAALKALTKYRQGVADQTYSQYLDRLSAMSTGGQAQTQNTNALGSNAAANIGTALGQQGVARASGYVGSANAWSNALGGVTNNAAWALGRLGQAA